MVRTRIESIVPIEPSIWIGPAFHIEKCKNGKRPPFPDNLCDICEGAEDLIALIEQCWHQDPAYRPLARDLLDRVWMLPRPPFSKATLRRYLKKHVLLAEDRMRKQVEECASL